MASYLVEIFEDETLIGKIKKKLPYFFQLAELERSRAGKIGVEERQAWFQTELLEESGVGIAGES